MIDPNRPNKCLAKWPFLAFALVLYLPCLTLVYIFHDDLLFWLKDDHFFNSFALSGSLCAQGRVLAAPLISLVGWLLGPSWILCLIRGLNITLIGLFGWVLAISLSKICREFHSILIALIIISLPAFGIIATRACDVLIPWVWLLSWAAAFCRGWLPRGLLFLSALFIYQPAAGMFWPAIILALIGDLQSSTGKAWENFRGRFLAGIFTLALYALMVRLIAKAFPKDWRGGFHDPLQYSTDIMAQAQWFIREPLANVFRAWDIFQQGPGPYAAGIVCLIALAMLFRRFGWASSVVLIVGLILSFLPNLAATGQASPYRCVGPLTVMVAVILTGAIAQVKRGQFVTVLLVFFLLWTAFTAQKSIMQARIIPSVKETAYVLNLAKALDTPRYRRYHFIRRPPGAVTRYDEWGALTNDYKHNGILFALWLASQKTNKSVPDYISSQEDARPLDYFVLSTYRDYADAVNVVSEKGSYRYLAKFKDYINSPEVGHFEYQGYTYFVFDVGFPAEAGHTVYFYWRDFV